MIQADRWHISKNEWTIGFAISLVLLALQLYLADKIGPFAGLYFLIAVAALLVIFLRPILGALFCFFVIFSGVVWGLGITKGFLPLAILSIAAWLGQRFYTFDFRFITDRQMFYLIGYLAMVVFSIFNAFYPQVSLQYLPVYGKLFLFYFFVANVFRTKRDVWAGIVTIILSVALSVLYGFYTILLAVNAPGELVVEGGRLRGLTDDPNAIGLAIVFVIPTLILLMIQLGKRLLSLLILLLVGFLSLGLMATFSRGASIALMVVLGIVWIQNKSWKLFFVTCLLIMALVVFVIPPEFWTHMKTLLDMGEFLRDASLRQRSHLLLGAINIFFEHPLTGIGIGNFVLISRDFVTEYLAVHNILFQVASETGIFGLVFFGLAFITTFSNFKDAKKHFIAQNDLTLAVAMQGFRIGFVGVAVACLFLSHQESFILWTMFGLSVAFRAVAHSLDPQSSRLG